MKKNVILFIAMAASCFIATRVNAQISLSAINAPYQQDFNTLAASGSGHGVGTLPFGWTFVETGSNADTTYTTGTGSSNAGNTYSFGTDASDRALGGLLSGSLTPMPGAHFINQTGTTITALEITYTGEQWRLGAASRTEPDRLDFQYSLDATSLTTGTWTDISALVFASPITSGTVGARDGNATENRTLLTSTLEGLAISDNATFWIRWTDYNISSSDDGLAIDDFSLTPIGTASDEPNMILSPSSLNFGVVHLGASSTQTYTLMGANLEDSVITIVASDPSFTISLDDVIYTDTLIVPNTATVYVKFIPTTDGSRADSLYHMSGSFSKAMAVQGQGYDPLQHILPIADARQQSIGTQVTVAGRITVANELGSPSYLQDDTGGIAVFDYTLSEAVALGDSVIITGPIGTFADQIQISGSGISFFIADTTTQWVTPQPITLSELPNYEGMLVTVQQVTLHDTAFVFYPESTETITAGTTTADLRIDGNTNLPGLTKPDTAINITGVVGRYYTNVQLLPRFQADVPGAAAPGTPADSIPKTHTLEILNWNLEFFGAEREDYPQEYGPADEPLQLANVAQVLTMTAADVIAVQEVSSDSLFAALVEQLPGYAGVCSDRYSYSFNGPDNTFPPQKVCFIYDTTTVTPVAFRPMFEALYDSARNGAATILPNYPTGSASSFWSSGRLPFLMTADITLQGTTERVSFINLHAKSGGSDAEDHQRRAYDIQVLHDSLAVYMADQKVVVLGDLNDDLDTSIISGLPTPYEVMVNDTAYQSISLALSLAGAKSTLSYNDVIDHQIITNELAAVYLAGSIQILTPFSAIPNYGNTTSDHLPVISRYQFEATETMPIIRFEETMITIEEGSGPYWVTLSLSAAPATEQWAVVSMQPGEGVSYGALGDYTLNTWPWNNQFLVNIPAGAQQVAFAVTPNNDLFTEDSAETITFVLQTVTDELQIGTQNTVTFRIIDVPPCVPVFFACPNPTFGNITLTTLPINQQNIVTGTLFSPSGDVLATATGTVDELSTAFSATLTGKPRGIYLIRLAQCDKIITLRVLKW